ncbi:hypothetical protein ALQ54_101742 [Pseudomonas syringae]|nr:hypothetical protein ALQ54_101742 [Pseudomonas syringae]
MSAYLHLSYLGFRAASCRPHTVMCSKRQAESCKPQVFSRHMLFS